MGPKTSLNMLTWPGCRGLSASQGVRAFNEREKGPLGICRALDCAGFFGAYAGLLHSNGMSFLTQLIQGITPAPVHTLEEYDGWEFRWKFFVFRPASGCIHFCYLRSRVTSYFSFEDRGIPRIGSFCLSPLHLHRDLA